MHKAERPRGRAALRSLAALLCALFCAALSPSNMRAQDNPAGELRRLRAAAAKAYEAKDYASYLLNMEKAAALWPGHPTLMYNLACAHALTGHGPEALRLLGGIARMGLVYSAEKDSDFDSIKSTAEFKAVLERFASNRLRAGRGEPALTLSEKGLVTEGVAYDPVEKFFYVSSIYRRKIVRARLGGATEDFAGEREGLWSVFGMKVDARRRLLWATTAAHPQMQGFREEENGASAVLKFDLRSGKLLKRYALPKTSGPHLLGDLTLDARGDVYTTDSLSPAIYRITSAKDEIEPFVSGAPFVSPQGLDFSPDGQLFVADYARGVFAVDTSTKKVSMLASPPDATLLFIDGLYFHRGALVCVQNGVNPMRVVRLRLDKSRAAVERFEVLEANSPFFDEPTLGVVVGDDLYYVANSQWEAIGRDGQLAPLEKLHEHVILKLKL
jgi:sugar lactone lactonase YvrE